jgi:hypothetical protein
MISFAGQLMFLVPVVLMGIALAVVLPKRVKRGDGEEKRPRMNSKGVIVG